MDIGERVRQRRLELGWSQEHLADRMRLRQNEISRLEAGKVKNPGTFMLRRLAKALNVTMDWLGGMYEDEPDDATVAHA